MSDKCAYVATIEGLGPVVCGFTEADHAPDEDGEAMPHPFTPATPPPLREVERTFRGTLDDGTPVEWTERLSLPPGYTLWLAWRDEMLAQGREVAPERMAWATLPDRDKELDAAIEARVVGIAHRALLAPEPAP